MKRTKRYYLAYGSNLNVHQMALRCPWATVVGTAEIDGYRLLFKGSKSGAYLTIEEAEGYKVPVAVWEVTAGDERYLDMYEGFPTFYYKKDFEITCKKESTGRKAKIKAFAYIMDERRRVGVPSYHYVGTCLEGYDAFGFDTEILLRAYEESKKEAQAV